MTTQILFRSGEWSGPTRSALASDVIPSTRSKQLEASMIQETTSRDNDARAGERFSGMSRGSTHVEHRLKCWPEFFAAIVSGRKTHDLRRADDRDFRVGDTLLLEEFDPKAEHYTGRKTKVRITYITSADSPCALSVFALHPDFCILSIALAA